MEKRPIEALMSATLESLRDMIDVNTIIGEPITTQDGSTVIPLSRVSFGFVSGGGAYAAKEKPVLSSAARAGEEEPPFAGGSGAGVSVQPLGFLVTGRDGVRLLPAQGIQPIDRLIELIPQAVNEMKRAREGEERE